MKIIIPKNDGTKTLHDLIKEQYPDRLENRFGEDYVDITNIGTNSIFVREIQDRTIKNINIDDGNENDEIGVNEIHIYTYGTISDLYIYSKDIDGIIEVRISKRVQ